MKELRVFFPPTDSLSLFTEWSWLWMAAPRRKRRGGGEKGRDERRRRVEDQRLRNVGHGRARALNTHATMNVHMQMLAHICTHKQAYHLWCNYINETAPFAKCTDTETWTRLYALSNQYYGTQTMLRCQVQRYHKICKCSPLNKLREVEGKFEVGVAWGGMLWKDNGWMVTWGRSYKSQGGLQQTQLFHTLPDVSRERER